jgi:type I restriction enzyme M protein
MKHKHLKDIVNEIRPGVTLTRFKVESGDGELVKVLSIKDINQDAIYLSPEIGDETEVKDASSLGKYVLRDGDVVISTKGSAIKTAAFRGTNELVANSNLSVIRCDESIMIPEYLTIFLKSEQAIHELQMKSKGSGILSLSTTDIGMIEVPVPSLETQKKLITLHKELETYTASRLEEIRLVKQTVRQKTEKILYK